MENDNTSIVKRKRGERGKDKQKRKLRNDLPSTAFTSSEKQNIMQHNIRLYKLNRINCNDITQLQNRIDEYFSICLHDELFPTVSGFAFALGIDRKTLWYWLANPNNCSIKNPDCFDCIKNTYDLINTQYEYMMNTGKINPVSGIFLMKNNFGYKDQTDHILTARQEQNETEEQLIDRVNLLTD